MNIYKISQTHNNKYDTFDSAIVAADNLEEARVMNPSILNFDGSDWDWETEKPMTPEKWLKERTHEWVKPIFVEVELIGLTHDGIEKGVIIGSFNAG